MTNQLLQTKLHIPPIRPSLVPRPHLIAKFNQGLHRKLTLISAPAGFGKTTLVSEWVYQKEEGRRTKDEGRKKKEESPLLPSSFFPHPSNVAWLSLDERDGDLARFLTYVVAALQTVAGDVGARVLETLKNPQPPPTEAILTALLNEIAAAPTKFVLVLDDYHVLESPPVDQALTFLLEHLPPQLHLVITTREDPPLPLPRLRVRGLLTELRAADLRFSAAETAVFLQKVTGLDLSSADVAALEKRTEGWIAGLQLAALSMQGRSDVHGFITAFAGDNRYIVDYLIEEVLQRQPPHVRRFLLQTSILDRLCGALCTAVTCQEGSGDLLETLERGNLFVIPLDDRRQWYRYHHLFADVLQAHAPKEQPEALADLHQRASRWYEAHDLLPEAVRHALAARDFERVADLAERAWPAMDRNRASHVWVRWVDQLPKAVVAVRPVLNACYAWAMLDKGELETAASRLQVVEQELAQGGPARPPTYADEAQFAALPATVAAARTYLALALGDLSATQTYARQALRLIPADDHHRRGTPAALLGLATWASGDLTAAYRSFSDAMASYQKAGNTLYAITGAFILADIRLAQGRLRDAVAVYERALALARQEGGAALRGLADLHTGLSELAVMQNDLEAAEKQLQQSKALGEETPLPRWRYRYCLAQARLRAATGHPDAAHKALDEAEQHYVRGPVPDLRTPGALKARLWAAQGNVAAARRWADAQGLAVDDDLSYLREFDHITLARIRLAQGMQDGAERPLREAHTLLSRLLTAAEAGGRAGSMLEILVLQALAHDAQGDAAAAQSALARALTLAAPQGYIRLFVDEGRAMAEVLGREREEGRGEREFVAQLLGAFAGQGEGVDESAVSEQPLVDPLSERELEVLQLVAEGLSNREIARRLYLALSTVKGHNRVIYGKLNVSRRTEAVARARELGLL